ncbi:MAG TPA: hypothetical protein VKG02_16745, partial [Blastocatellia bacterium]|nr:hypothetical protein [Blastocatellia bacterium]
MLKSMRYRSFALSLFFIAPILAGGVNAQPIPAPPTERADRFGVYNWGVDYDAYPANATIDRLNWAADKVAELGSRTIRVAMPGDIY